MRILFFLPSLSGGGAERVVFNLIRGLQDYDVKVDLIVTFEDGLWHNQLPKHCILTNLNKKHVIQSLIPLIKHIRENRPDILISAIDNANLVNILASKLSGEKVKSVITIHQVNSEFHKLYGNKREKILNMATKLIFPFVDQIVAVSQSIKMDLLKRSKISNRKVIIIGNPIIHDGDIQKLVPYKKEKSDQVRIVAFGRLAIEKDFCTLIRAFHLFVKRVGGVLIIFGIGPERKALLDLINELALSEHVILAGFVDDVCVHMKQANLCVVSSITEGFCNVIVEALACGIPVVATDCGGPREILLDGALGKLVPVKDANSLGIAMENAMKTSYDPSILINRARDFTIENISHQYMMLFQNMIAG